MKGAGSRIKCIQIPAHTRANRPVRTHVRCSARGQRRKLTDEERKIVSRYKQVLRKNHGGNLPGVSGDKPSPGTESPTRNNPPTPPRPSRQNQGFESRPVKEAKNRKEARAELERVVSEGIGIPVEKIRISSKLSVDDLNQRNQQLQDLSDQYTTSPIRANKPAIVSMTSSKSFHGVVKTRTSRLDGESWIHEMNFGHENSSLATERARVITDSLGGRRVIPSNFTKIDSDKQHLYTLTHEFGHVIATNATARTSRYSSSFKDNHDGRFFTELKSVQTRYHNELKQARRTQDPDVIFKTYSEKLISKYAATNINEFMAEGFTEYKLSSTPGPYAVEVGQLIDKYYGKGGN